MRHLTVLLLLGFPAAAAADEPALDPTVAAVVDSLGQGKDPDGICFAWSETEKAIACATSADSIQEGIDSSVVFLSAGKRDEVVYLKWHEGQFFGDLPPESYDKKALDTIRARLRAGAYAPWTAGTTTLKPKGKVTVAKRALRRKRKRTKLIDEGTGSWWEYKDTIEQRCGAKWRRVSADEASFGNNLEPADILVHKLPSGEVLMTATVSWHIEGDGGGASNAMLLGSCKK